MKIIKNNMNFATYFFGALIWLIVFQNPIERVVPLFKYFDESISIIIFIIGIYLLKKQKDLLSKDEKAYSRLIMGLLGIIIFIGVIGDVFTGYNNIYYILIDIITFLKFFLFLFGVYIYSKSKKKQLSEKIILKNIYIIVLAILVLFIIDLVGRIFNYSIFPYHDIRHGIKSFQLIWSHPTFLASSCIFIICLQLYFCKVWHKTNIFFFICSILFVICTFRTKAIIGLIICLVLAIYIRIFNKKIGAKEIAFILICVFLLGFQQFHLYFIQYSNNGARARLTNTSFEIANENFPIGSGFATYGSATTTKDDNYSKLYYKYGLNSIYGLEKNNTIFISDTFWPTIIGETGYLGLISYVIIIISLLLMINKQNIEKNLYCAKLFALFYLLISSTGESAFFNPISIAYALIIALYTPKD